MSKIKQLKCFVCFKRSSHNPTIGMLPIMEIRERATTGRAAVSPMNNVLPNLRNQNREFQTDEEVISLNLHPWRSSQELPLIDCSQFPLNNTSTSPSTSHTGTQGTSPGKSKRRRSQTINFMYMNQACRKYFDCGSIILFKLLS